MSRRPGREMWILDADLSRLIRDLCLEAEAQGRPRPGVKEMRAAIGPVGHGRIARALHRLIDVGAVPTQAAHLDNDGYRPTPDELLAELDRAGAARASLKVPERPGVADEPTETQLRSRDLYLEHMARERRLRRGVAS